MKVVSTKFFSTTDSVNRFIKELKLKQKDIISLYKVPVPDGEYIMAYWIKEQSK